MGIIRSASDVVVRDRPAAHLDGAAGAFTAEVGPNTNWKRLTVGHGNNGAWLVS